MVVVYLSSHLSLFLMARVSQPVVILLFIASRKRRIAKIYESCNILSIRGIETAMHHIFTRSLGHVDKTRAVKTGPDLINVTVEKVSLILRDRCVRHGRD